MLMLKKTQKLVESNFIELCKALNFSKLVIKISSFSPLLAIIGDLISFACTIKTN